VLAFFNLGGRMDPGISEGWERLGRSILLQAFEDLRNTNGRKWAKEAGLPEGVTLAWDAWQFLGSDGAQLLAAWLGHDPQNLERVVAELPRPAPPQQLSMDFG
jgi:hypothetical protein